MMIARINKTKEFNGISGSFAERKRGTIFVISFVSYFVNFCCSLRIDINMHSLYITLHIDFFILISLI